MRGLAGYDPARYAAVTRFPLAEALLAYEQQLRDSASHEYEFALLLYVIKNSNGFGKKTGKPPEIPAILKEG